MRLQNLRVHFDEPGGRDCLSTTSRQSKRAVSNRGRDRAKHNFTEQLASQAAAKELAGDEEPQRSRSKRKKRSPDKAYVFDKDKPVIPYHGDCQFLKSFILDNFNENDFIDYEAEVKALERNFKNQNELEQDFAQEGSKYWNMLAQHVVFRESTLINKQQAFLKKQSMANKQAQQKKLQEEKLLSDRKKVANPKHLEKEDPHKELISADEVKFLQTKSDLEKKIVTYYQDMERKGHLTAAEKRFLKHGVVF